MGWIHDLIADKPVGAPAIIDHDGTVFSYGDLRDMVGEASAALSAAGLRPGDRLMIAAENCALYPVAVLAASQLEAWAMPVNARQTEEEMTALRTHSGARLMVFTDQVSAEAAARSADFGASVRARLACGPLTVTDPADTQPEPVPDIPAKRVAALMYTTGTTSAPKGVMLSHANLSWNAQASSRLRGMRPDDIVLGVLPGTHIFGFSSTMMATFWTGAAIRFLARFTPQAVLAALGDGASVMPAVPQMYAHILTHLETTGGTVEAPRLHYISAGGAPLDPDWKRRTEAAFGLPLHNGMGMTECSPTMAATRVDNPSTDTSVGRAVDDVELWIDAPDETGVGELMVRSPGVMLGYYRDPEATAKVLRDNVLHTGDLARIEADGTVHIVGRLKELIIRSGFNVYPPELEAMLTKHPAIDVAAVVGRPAKGGNEEIVAFVLGRDVPDAADLRDWLRDHLAPYKLPQHIIAIDAFPTAATGKILKHKLLGHFADRLPPEEI